MGVKRSSKIFPHLWYAKEAEEAAAFYASIFPDSRVDRVTPLLSDSPSGPPGSVKVVDFTLFGQRFLAISAGPLDPFNHAISLVVVCNDQAELDRYRDAVRGAAVFVFDRIFVAAAILSLVAALLCAFLRTELRRQAA